MKTQVTRLDVHHGLSDDTQTSSVRIVDGINDCFFLLIISITFLQVEYSGLQRLPRGHKALPRSIAVRRQHCETR